MNFGLSSAISKLKAIRAGLSARTGGSMEKLNTVVCSTGHFTLNDNNKAAGNKAAGNK